MASRIDNNFKNLILIRHGQSTYNLQNRFTGWEDVALTQKGINEAKNAVALLENLPIDIAYTSMLKRAQHTLKIILLGLNLDYKMNMNEKLNERDYGSLVGQNKTEAAKKFGTEQVQIWRRSYNIAPPNGESLEMTYKRCIPYFKKNILSQITQKNIIVSAHGNSIRAIVKYLLNLSESKILKTEIGWCEPWVFKFNKKNIIDLKIKYKNKSSSFLPLDINELF